MKSAVAAQLIVTLAIWRNAIWTPRFVEIDLTIFSIVIFPNMNGKEKLKQGKFHSQMPNIPVSMLGMPCTDLART